MTTVVLIIHVIVSLALILIVLIQTGRGASLSGFLGGGGSSDALFGGPGGDVFLKKVTAVLAIVFMVTSISLTVLSRKRESILDKVPPPPMENQVPQAESEQE